jgi:hypothetical protein
MAVVRVRVPQHVRAKMKAYREVVNWPEEVERTQTVEEAIRLLEAVPSAPPGTAQALAGEDRNRY